MALAWHEIDAIDQTSESTPNTSSMTDDELAAALSELDEIWETAERELEAAQARGEALQRLEHDRDTPMEAYAGMVSETLRTSRLKSAAGYTSCSGLAFASARASLWRPWASSRRWQKRRSRVCRSANHRHLAYKGPVERRRPKRTPVRVR